MALAVVQSAQSSYNAIDMINPEITFGAAPTSGNLLVAICMSNSSPSFTAGTGWTMEAHDDGAQSIGVFTKYAGAGESATQTPNTKQANQWTVMAWEVSGVSGTHSADVVAVYVAHLITPFPGVSGSPTPFNTVHNSDMVLYAASGNAVASGTQFTTSTGTLDNQLPGTVVDGLGTFEVGTGWHYAVPTAGTTIAPTITSNNGANMSAASIELQPGTVIPPAHFAEFTQYTEQVLAIGDSIGRLTQFGLHALGKTTVTGRLTQMSLLVLAKGGEGPLTPNPLSLHDAGLSPVLRQRFVNMYPEQTPQGPSESARYQRGGLYGIAQYGGGPVQVMEHWTGPVPTQTEFLMTISGGAVFRDNVNIGVVDPFVDPVWFPKGRRIHVARSETQFMACSNGKLYSISLTDVTQVATSDVLPAGIRDIAFLGGRFVYILDDDSGQFYWSAIGDGTVIDGLSFATDAEDDPRALLAVWELSDDLVFMTTDSIEFWFVSSDPNNPYQRSQGRRFNKGLLAQDTVELVDNSLFWLGSDRQIYRTGAGPVKVSTFDIDNLIRKLGDDEVQQCYAYGVTFGGHNFYVINLMSRGTWALDIASKTWAQWETWNRPNFRVFCTDDTFRVMGDSLTGRLMGMDGGIYTDLGDPLERVVSSYYPWQKGRNNNFNVILHCTRGVGGRVEMRFSDHEGHDWVPWEETSMGDTGDRDESAKAQWVMLGGMSPPGRAYEFRCTDDCFFAPFKLRVDEQWA